MKLYDGHKRISVTMAEWSEQSRSYGPDLALEFFSDAKYDSSHDVYVVEDVDYCAQQAEDWANLRGDFAGDELAEGISREVDIEDCSAESEEDFSSALSLYDGDWRSSDRDLLQSEFALTEEE